MTASMQWETVSVGCTLYFLLTAFNKSNPLSESGGVIRHIGKLIGLLYQALFHLVYYSLTITILSISLLTKTQWRGKTNAFSMFVLCIHVCSLYSCLFSLVGVLVSVNNMLKKIFKGALCKNLLTKYEGITVLKQCCLCVVLQSMSWPASPGPSWSKAPLLAV